MPSADDWLKRCPRPSWVQPMLATLTERRFSDPDWIFEPKLDGIRCLAFGDGREVRIFSRNRIPLNASYLRIVESLKKQKILNFILDGEVVAFKNGLTSFSELQRAKMTGVPVFYYVFDLLYLEGYDVTGLGLLQRKKLLKRFFSFKNPVYAVTFLEKDGEAYFKEACRKGWEGLIAKRSLSPYAHRRSADWLKFKCTNRQEFVIGGFTRPRGSRIGFGALLLGYYEKDRLRYAGKVGTGYDEQTLRSLSKKLLELEQPVSAFSEPTPEPAHTHWVKPQLVAETVFTEWTRDGRLRHPRFAGLRSDKSAREITREKGV